MPVPESIRASIVLPASAERLYRAFLDAEEHAAFTGAAATITPRVGGKLSAIDGSVTGKVLELVPHERIVLSWRTSDFAEGDPDSRVELLFHAASGGTRVTVIHTEIPPGHGERFETGWHRDYFEPMRAYFRAGAAPPKPATASVSHPPSSPAAAAKPRRPRRAR